MSRIFLIPFLCLAVLASAKNYENIETRLTAIETEINCKHKAIPDLKNKNSVFITADYLYWLAQEEGLSYATNLSLNPITNEQKGKVQNLNFEWDSGFRAGIGYRMPHDHWELFANWTHFITTADAQTMTLTNYLYPEWATMVGPVAGNLVSYVDARWDLHLNLIDGNIARTFRATNCLSLRPQFGVRGAWIDQSYKTNLSGGQNGTTAVFADNIKMTNNFKGVGFRAAVDTNWSIWRCFSLFGNIGGSFIYGNFYVRRIEQQSTSTQIALSTAIDILNEFHQIVPTLDIALGLRFDYNFSRRVAARFQAGWEFNDFFSQNKLEHLLTGENSTYAFIANNSDLTTQGLTVSARLDF